MRKVYIEVKFRLIIEAEEGIEISDIMNELDYDFHTTDYDGEERKLSDVVDTEMLDYEIIDSK
jgi:hypothetical protein